MIVQKCRVIRNMIELIRLGNGMTQGYGTVGLNVIVDVWI